jgi:hypothetical protein
MPPILAIRRRRGKWGRSPNTERRVLQVHDKEFRLSIKRKEAAGMAVSPARRFSGMTQNLPDGCLYNEFKNAMSACFSLGLSSRKRFLSCSASPP